LWPALRLPVHLALHVLLPLAAARLLWRTQWLRAFGVMLAANLVDLDHLLATPVYDPSRCSIGNHPLHSYWAIGAYVVVAVVAPHRSVWRMLAVGLLLHMAVDGADAWILQ
jgi:hypothetical protein